MEQQQFKVISMLAPQSGVSERGEWRSQEIILEEVANVQYPDQYLVTFRGDKVDMLKGIKAGDTVTAHWSAYVRSYKSKDGLRDMHAQQLNGWKIENVTTF